MNTFKHLSQQCDETWNKLKEKKQTAEIFLKNHREAKQYDTKQPMDHWRNQRGNKKSK